MISALIIIAALVTFACSAPGDRYIHTVYAFISSCLFGFILMAILGTLNHGPTYSTPVTLVTESATHVVLAGPASLTSVNRAVLKYADNCEGYMYQKDSMDRWIMGFHVPYESYYISCEG